MNTFEVSTKFGPVSLKPTQADHIYVELPAEGFSVRGVEINGSIHMHRWTDGVWRYGPEFTEERGQTRQSTSYDRSHSAWLKRRDWLSRPRDQGIPSVSAQDAIKQEVSVHVNTWASLHPSILDEAEKEHIEGLIDSQASKVDGMAADLQKEKDKLYQLRERLYGQLQLMGQ